VAAVPWPPTRIDEPKYLLATSLSTDRVALRPVFVSRLRAVGSPLWPGPVWRLPDDVAFSSGTFLFTLRGELVGMVVDEGGPDVIVPAAALVAEVDRILQDQAKEPGELGVQVQSLTPALSRVLNAPSGVVVTWIDPKGAAAEVLRVGDVIDTVANRPVTTPWQWNARIARLAAGEEIEVRVHSGDTHRQMWLTAKGALISSDVPDTLGLTLRPRGELGTEVVAVKPRSPGEHAGFIVQDVITVFGGVAAPTPGQIRSRLAEPSSQEPLVAAVTRGSTHLLIPIER
jgi:S1-C subfamily serine protease